MTIDKRIWLPAAVIAAGILVLVVVNFVRDPLAEEREWLETKLRQVPERSAPGGLGDAEFGALSQAITAKPWLWEPLVEPPKKVIKEAAPPPKPDLKKMLSGIRVTRMQIGDKVQVVTPENKRGKWVQVGEKIKGCTLESYSRDEVTFSYYWDYGDEKLTITVPRR